MTLSVILLPSLRHRQTPDRINSSRLPNIPRLVRVRLGFAIQHKNSSQKSRDGFLELISFSSHACSSCPRPSDHPRKNSQIAFRDSNVNQLLAWWSAGGTRRVIHKARSPYGDDDPRRHVWDSSSDCSRLNLIFSTTSAQVVDVGSLINVELFPLA
jgi:hypothetical protein